MTRPAASEPVRRSSFVCDLARACAALAVLGAHAREFVLADLPSQPQLSPGGRLFFGLTALGHQAVIVFLVLSGFLITASARAAWDAGRWSPAAFAQARLTRLWVVLLPCLVLGGLEDAGGIAFAQAHGLEGYGLRTDVEAVLAQLGPAVFIGNLMFVQGFRVPVFGSNVPLWTLAVEFWCYAGLLTAACAWSWRRSRGRLAGLASAGAAVAVMVLPQAFWALCPIWCTGALLVFVERLRSGGLGPASAGSSGTGLRSAILLVVAAAILVLARAVAMHHLALSDYGLGVASAICLAAAPDWNPQARIVRAPVRTLAGLSYTLYLAHVPLFALLDAVVLRHKPLAWGPVALAVWCAAVALALLQAGALWWLFERHTQAVRRVLEPHGRRAPPVLAPWTAPT